jgi:hypothetical protein
MLSVFTEVFLTDDVFVLDVAGIIPSRGAARQVRRAVSPKVKILLQKKSGMKVACCTFIPHGYILPEKGGIFYKKIMLV